MEEETAAETWGGLESSSRNVADKRDDGDNTIYGHRNDEGNGGYRYTG